MNKLIISCLILITVGSIKAQQSSRFPITSSSEWRIDFAYPTNNPENQHSKGDEIFKLHILGDTVIHSTAFFKLYKSGVAYYDTLFHYENVYVGAIRDDNNKIYFIEKNNSSEDMLFDFNLNVGDTVKSLIDKGKVVNKVDLLPDSRKKIYVYKPDIIDICGTEDTLVEGIGGSGGLFSGHPCIHLGHRGNYLVCYKENGSIVYQTEWYGFYPSCEITIATASRFPLSYSSTWRVDHIRNGVSNENKHIEGDEIYKYFINGDTVINTKSYLKIYKTGVAYLDAPFYYKNIYSGAIRDEDNKFFYVKKIETAEKLLYNFNAKIDNTIQVPYNGTFETKIVSSIDKLPDGRRLIHFNPKIPIVGCGDQYFIEGIGGSGGLLEGHACNHFWTSDNHLVCYVKNGQLIYHDNNFEFNCDIIENQSIDKYLDSTCVWRVDKQKNTDTTTNLEKLNYFICGDTIIQDTRYMKLCKSGFQLYSSNNGQYISRFNDSVYSGALRAYNNKLLYIENGKNEEELLYNFSLKTGDAVDGKIFYGDTIKGVDTILDNRRVYYLSDNHWENKIIEGIGSNKGLLENNDENSTLICFMKNNASVYHDGTGTECILDFNSYNFYDCDKLRITPNMPSTNDEVKLVSRICYQVSYSDPYYPTLLDKKVSNEENAFSIELTFDYNDQNASDNIKIINPATDTTSFGTLNEGNYSVDVIVHTIHHTGDSTHTVFNDKNLYVGFSVVQGNKIQPRPDIRQHLKVYPVPSKGTVTIEADGQNAEIHSIEIYDILGTKIETISNSSGLKKVLSFKIQHLNKGVYFLKVNGNISNLVQKIVVE